MSVEKPSMKATRRLLNSSLEGAKLEAARAELHKWQTRLDQVVKLDQERQEVDQNEEMTTGNRLRASLQVDC
jgi:hypothetical protein